MRREHTLFCENGFKLQEGIPPFFIFRYWRLFILNNIIGISAFYHDSAACLLRDGEIIAAAQEERFTRKKHDARFPSRAVEYVLREGEISIRDIDYIVYYDKPFLTFERILETYLAHAPAGFLSFVKSMPLWLRKKLNIPKEIRKHTGYAGKILFASHHESHAASAFFPSPFDEAAIICFDGVGEWATTSIWTGKGDTIAPLKEIHFPHSIGLLYSAFTYFTGFKVNSGEYKLMGLAPYGEPKYVDPIYNELIDVREDGSFHMNMGYFNYCRGLTMTNRRFNRLFGGPPRKPESEITQREMDIAASIQRVTEEIMMRIAQNAYQETGMKNLCLAGGVALNCVGNGRIHREGPFSKLWIQPASGDAGGAIGAAYVCLHRFLKKGEIPGKTMDRQHGSYLGPSFTEGEIERNLRQVGASYTRVEESDLYGVVAERIERGDVIGWFSGRMEFGPRALGNRSIIGDPRNPDMQKRMNLKIKFRESFRPFAPAVLIEEVSDWFDMTEESPYMLLVAPLRKERTTPGDEMRGRSGLDMLYAVRSEIPAVTHVDYSARIQTVHKETNPRFYALLKAFFQRTGCPVLINTSFNVRGEPIVCTPEDAYRCFMRTEMDMLVMENFILYKNDQKKWTEEKDWKEEFVLD